MTNHATFPSLLAAVERYFDLMFDSNVSHLDQVFASSAQLHGLRDGNLRLLTAQDYKTALAAGASPKAKRAPRHQEILLVDCVAHTGGRKGPRQDRFDAVSRLSLLPLHQRCVADYGQVISYRAAVRGPGKLKPGGRLLVARNTGPIATALNTETEPNV